MTFNSLTFIVFFICLLIALYFVKGLRKQHILFLVANFIFYAYWDYRLFCIILIEIAIVYIFGRLIEVNKKRWCIVVPTIMILLILGYFKYYNFFVSSFCSIFHVKNSLSLKILLPLGISFYTFQALSYLFDINKGKIVAEKSLLKVAVYISFFPQIISGPIVKAHDFLPQLEEFHVINKEQLSKGCQIFLIGLLKKVVIADRIGMSVDAVFATPMAYDGISIIMSVIGYSVQIYCDFSGYSDMANGIAKIMGFNLGRNFNAPYLAKNPSDFWRRWHISLSTWFRDYLYIPLGGSRKGKIRTYINLVITMIVSGLWHGASWNFIIWGACHGLASAFHKLFRDSVNKYNLHINNIQIKQVVDIVSIIINYCFISLMWIVFRTGSLEQVYVVLVGMCRITGINYISPFVIVYCLLILLAHVWCLARNGGEGKYIVLNVDKMGAKIYICLLILLIIALMYTGNSAFIYAQF